ncbi:MAG TPA: DsbA family protein [Actinomycetales bacterium]|nr:DsbA family protein [Actinomycetales bacterium]
MSDPPAHEHARGDPSAPVTVLEFGDYECPYCAAAEPVLRALVAESDGRIRLVFRNFPLADLHPYALTAALAAEASAPFGVFWEMHDLLFENQHRLTDADLSAYADSLGVDGARVVGDAAQPCGDVVEGDFAAGVEMGVRGTPWLFVDGVHYEGRMDLAALRRAAGASTGPGGFVPGTRRQAR